MYSGLFSFNPIQVHFHSDSPESVYNFVNFLRQLLRHFRTQNLVHFSPYSFHIWTFFSNIKRFQNRTSVNSWKYEIYKLSLDSPCGCADDRCCLGGPLLHILHTHIHRLYTLLNKKYLYYIIFSIHFWHPWDSICIQLRSEWKNIII